MANERWFSSQSNEWTTPRNIFDSLNRDYNFTLDPCCTKESALCQKYFTQAENGLAQSWASERVFMNPPYGRETGYWIKKAYEESRRGAIVVCLIPARTDTRYWHDFVMRAAKIIFIKGRLKFGGGATAPFPSAVIVFDGTQLVQSVTTMERESCP